MAFNLHAHNRTQCPMITNVAKKRSYFFASLFNLYRAHECNYALDMHRAINATEESRMNVAKLASARNLNLNLNVKY